jgi:SPP1 gp7 family putative phage head morphogenesis protein
MLRHSPLRKHVAAEARKVSNSVRRQLAVALGKPVTAGLEPQEQRMGDAVYDRVDEGIGEAVERGANVLNDWDGEDVEALATKLDDGLDGILGSVLASAALAYGYMFADMNRTAQVEAGVGEYAWIAQKDSATRPEHRALDGEQSPWDVPLLTAEESSSGEECYPGDDFFCRCVASPVIS